MSRILSRPPVPLVLIAVLIGLLAVLATLQYRWIGEISRAEHDRMQASLETGITRFSGEFDRTIAMAFRHFQPIATDSPATLDTSLQVRWNLWEAQSPWPELIGALWVVELDPGDTLRRFDPVTGRLQPAEWPEDLSPIRQSLTERRAGPGQGPPLFPEVPALVMPTHRPERSDFGSTHESELLIVQFDRAIIVQKILPTLAREHFPTRVGEETVIEVVEPSPRPRLLWSSNPGAPPIQRPDATRPLMTLAGVAGIARSEGFGGIPGMGAGRGAGRQRGPGPHRGRPFGIEGPGGEVAPTLQDPLQPLSGAWQVRVSWGPGSLDAMVASTRLRNLAISLGVLALLAVTIVMLLRSAHQAHLLARQQMEFVAGVTHELNTPLAAIRSAGQNLADGVVEERGQVQRYGTMIADEGRRLSAMVAGILEFAGMRASRNLRRERVELDPLLDAALGSVAHLLESQHAAITRDVEPRLAVNGDPDALRRVLENLLTNAARYGGPDVQIRIAARRHGSHAELAIRNNGPEIDRDDLPHLFEPFFRGRHVESATIRGSGLGLSIVRSIVERHGGTVTVTSRDRETAFVVRLPVADEGQES